MTLIPLQVKQTTTKFKVSGLANGDSIVSYTSSNPKVFTVNKNGKIVVAKGTKKGTYQVKVTVKAKNYKTVNKYITVTVK